MPLAAIEQLAHFKGEFSCFLKPTDSVEDIPRETRLPPSSFGTTEAPPHQPHVRAAILECRLSPDLPSK